MLASNKGQVQGPVQLILHDLCSGPILWLWCCLLGVSAPLAIELVVFCQLPLMHKTAHQLQLLGQPAQTLIEVFIVARLCTAAHNHLLWQLVTPNLPETEDFQLLESVALCLWQFVVSCIAVALRFGCLP